MRRTEGEVHDHAGFQRYCRSCMGEYSKRYRVLTGGQARRVRTERARDLMFEQFLLELRSELIPLSVAAEHIGEIERRLFVTRRSLARVKGRKRGQSSVWRSSNPEKVLAQKLRRRYRSLKEIKLVSRTIIFERSGGICYLCGCGIEFGSFHLEHRTPLIRGGSHSYENVSAACAPCNLRKHTKTALEFLMADGVQEE